MDELLCDVCGADCDTLYGKGIYSGNKDTRMMCEHCYCEVFDTDFEYDFDGVTFEEKYDVI